MGDKYFKYDSANNNCQDYIMGLLEASSLGSPENYTFIKQNTKQLFEGLGKTRAIAKTITNIGQKANIVMSGGAIEGNYLTASIVFPMSFGLPLAKKWLKANHYKAGKPFIEGETWRFRQMSPLAIKKAGFNDYKTKIIENGIELLLVYKKIINGNSIMPKLVKGSKEAKDKMAKMRAMRKIKGGTVQSKEGEAIENVEGTGLFAGAGCGKGLYAGRGIDSDSDSDSSDDEPEKVKIIHHHHHHHYKIEGGNILKDLKTVGKQTASVLIHKGIPKVASALGAMAGTTATGSPVGTFVGGVAGEKLGDLIAKKVGKKTGLGLKKGSQEAKDHMAKIRAMRK